MRVYFEVLGCKLNQAEAERWAREFTAAGYQVVDSPALADLIITHSCTVTGEASRKSRQMARRAARKGKVSVLTGCYAQVLHSQGKQLEGIDLIVGTGDTPRLLQVLQEHGLKPHSPTTSPSLGPKTVLGRTRAFVKVQDGCNMVCAFCIIPLTRGRERSNPLDAIVDEVKRLTDLGYQEIVITGVQISSYRYGPYRLHDLVAAILEQTEIPRLRLSSIAPWDLNDRLLALWENPRLCRHLHLSLQSGCDATLRRMRRPYTAARYAEIVARARERIPGVGITTDVIVGFPGETDEEFAQSLAFVREMEFTRVHVFPYSPRPGTEGASLPEQVPEAVKKERVKAMQEVGLAGARAFARRFVGQTLPVLWETSQADVWSGYTDNYLRAITHYSGDLANQITAATIIDVDTEGVKVQIG